MSELEWQWMSVIPLFRLPLTITKGPEVVAETLTDDMCMDTQAPLDGRANEERSRFTCGDFLAVLTALAVTLVVVDTPEALRGANLRTVVFFSLVGLAITGPFVLLSHVLSRRRMVRFTIPECLWFLQGANWLWMYLGHGSVLPEALWLADFYLFVMVQMGAAVGVIVVTVIARLVDRQGVVPSSWTYSAGATSCLCSGVYVFIEMYIAR